MHAQSHRHSLPQADVVRVVLDNLSTRTPAGLIWSKPRSASYGVNASTAASTKKDRLLAEISAWEAGRNLSGARTKWMFTTQRARAKLAHAYPIQPKES